VKFPNDGNGKKALWRKSLDDTVKKLMTSKANDTLSASQLRNPAYKNHIGSFACGDLHNPDMVTSDDENSKYRVESNDVNKFRLEHNNETTSNPMHNGLSDVCITPLNVEDKESIKNKLNHMLNHSNNIDKSK
jgi:hypothetical protein